LRHLTAFKIVSVATVKQGASLEVAYTARLKRGNGGALSLIAELTKIEGVQGVEWKEQESR
jgi:hypothetical protein